MFTNHEEMKKKDLRVHEMAETYVHIKRLLEMVQKNQMKGLWGSHVGGISFGLSVIDTDKVNLQVDDSTSITAVVNIYSHIPDFFFGIDADERFSILALDNKDDLGPLYEYAVVVGTWSPDNLKFIDDLEPREMRLITSLCGMLVTCPSLTKISD